MTKNIIILTLSLLLVWFGVSLVRVENQRYALLLETCGSLTPDNLVTRMECLKNVETRTGPIYHLIYGLGLL